MIRLFVAFFVFCLSVQLKASCPKPPVPEIVDSIQAVFKPSAAADSSTETPFFHYLDVEYMTKAVVGRFHWNQASPQDIEKLFALYKTMINKQYRKFLLSQAHKRPLLDINPKLVQDDGERFSLTGYIKRPKRARAPVTFFFHCHNAQTWKLYDIAFDNLYLLEQIKLQFATVIRHGGIPALIKELNKLNDQN